MTVNLRYLVGFMNLCLLPLVDCTNTDFYSFTVQDITGEDVDLNKYRDTISLVVNVASECGFTASHYQHFSEIQEYLGADEKFQVLIFPCNQFGEQEPGDNFAIFETISSRYFINYPVFAKIDVKGENASPAFQNLIEQSGQEPTWNFWKYLVNAEGKVVGVWPHTTSIDDIYDAVKDEVQALGGAKDAPEKKIVHIDDEL